MGELFGLSENTNVFLVSSQDYLHNCLLGVFYQCVQSGEESGDEIATDLGWNALTSDYSLYIIQVSECLM